MSGFIRQCQDKITTRLPISMTSVPIFSPIQGARWVEASLGRLKIILATGGCKTPTCIFCSLPRFGRAIRACSPSATLREAISRYPMDELALYNDGSLLNPAEVNPEELDKLWRVVRSQHVKRLWIETIPRFVSRCRLEEVLEKSGVQELTVAMGLQCLGDKVAMGLLGRPDPDAVFEKAIEAAKLCGVRVRLYLLWGHPLLSESQWNKLILSSVHWATAREVDIVTVCPFVQPDVYEFNCHLLPSICLLREVLSQIKTSDLTRVNVSLHAQPTCGESYFAKGCLACIAALQAATWENSQLCTAITH